MKGGERDANSQLVSELDLFYLHINHLIIVTTKTANSHLLHFGVSRAKCLYTVSGHVQEKSAKIELES